MSAGRHSVESQGRCGALAGVKPAPPSEGLARDVEDSAQTRLVSTADGRTLPGARLSDGGAGFIPAIFARPAATSGFLALRGCFPVRFFSTLGAAPDAA